MKNIVKENLIANSGTTKDITSKKTKYDWQDDKNYNGWINRLDNLQKYVDNNY